MLTAANLEIRAALDQSHQARSRRRGSRRGIEAIDAVLGEVEEYNLSRRRPSMPIFARWRSRLEEEGGLSIPQPILDLRHTVRLHQALMDWQQELLDAA